MTADNTTVNEIVIRARTEGVQKATTDLDQLAVAEERVVNAEGQAVVVTEKTTRARLSAAAALDRLQRQLDAEYRATRDLAAANRLLDRARSQGLLSIAEHNRLSGFATRRHEEAAAAALRSRTANDNLAGSYRGLGTNLGAVTAGLRSNLAAFAGLVATIGGGVLVGSIAKAGLEMESLERGFAAAAGSAQQGGREFAFIRDTADRLGLSLSDTSKQYLSFLAASRGTALQGQDTRDIFVAVSSAMGALGKGTDETGRALTAVQQMMSKGKVSAEEMTGQLGEALPGALSLSAKAMGMTTAELLKFMGEGKLLASDLLPKLAKELQATYGGAALDAANGLRANLNRLSTAWLDTRDTIARNGLNDALGRASGDLAGFLRDNQDAAASFGRTMAGTIDGLRAFGAAAVDTYDSARIVLQMIGEFDQATTRQTVDTGGIEAAFSNATGGIADAARNDVNTVIGIFVAGYDLSVAAWNGLPGAFGSLGAAAGNLLISAVESAINFVITGANRVVDAINGIASAIPGISFTPLEKAAAVTFGRIEAASAGAAGKLADDFGTIARTAMGRDYLGEAGSAITNRFNELKEASRATREEQRRLADEAKANRLGDALRNTGDGAKQAAENLDKAGKAAKQASQEFGKLKSEAEAAAKSLFPEEMLKRQGADLQAQVEKYRTEFDKLDPVLKTALETKIKLNLEGKEIEGVKNKTDDLSKEMSRTFSGVFDDMFSAGNKGLDGMLDSITKGFSRIGTRMIEKNLITPLFEGDAANNNGLPGGFDLFKNFDFDKMMKSVTEGTSSGLDLSFDKWLKPGKEGGGFASTPLGGGLLAVGSGAAIGYQSQNPLMGALGGGLAGLMTGNPYLAAAGPMCGFGGMIGQRRKANDKPKPTTEKPADDRDQRPLAA